MKTQAKVAIGICVLLVAGLLGYFLAVRADDKKQEKAIDTSSAPSQAAVPEVIDRKALAADVAENGVVLGAPGTTEVKVQEFMDFQCPYCRQQQPLVEAVISQFAGKATVSVRPFPLTNIHPNAKQAWTAALAANEQGKFGEMYKKLFNSQDDWAETSADESARFRGFAEELGLNMATYDQAIASPEYSAMLDATPTTAASLGVESTPTWVVDGKVPDIQTGEDLYGVIEQALKDAA